MLHQFHHFVDYVIISNAVAYDVIGHPDIRNRSSRVDKQGSEVRFTLLGTDKKAMASYIYLEFVFSPNAKEILLTVINYRFFRIEI